MESVTILVSVARPELGRLYTQTGLMEQLGLNRNQWYSLRAARVIPAPRTSRGGVYIRKRYSGEEAGRIYEKLVQIGAIR